MVDVRRRPDFILISNVGGYFRRLEPTKVFFVGTRGVIVLILICACDDGMDTYEYRTPSGTGTDDFSRGYIW